MIERTYHKITYNDGTTEEFNPFFRWRFGSGMAEVSIKYDWGIGAMWKWTIGSWSRFKTRFVKIGPLTIYLHYGMTEPHNPQTGEVY